MGSDEATVELRELLTRIAEPVPFGPSVSEEFQRGYAAGRADILPLVDTSITAILIEQQRSAPAVPSESRVPATVDPAGPQPPDSARERTIP
jgi:hypothetical protein